MKNIIGNFSSSMFKQSSILHRPVQQFEYNPMINSRAHKVGQEGSDRNKILNKTFRQTYD